MLFLFLLAALAVYRIVMLLTQDDGPGDIVFIFRDWVGVYDYGYDRRAKTNVGRLFACPRCLSVWLALPTAVCIWWGDWPMAALGWLAVSGAVLLMVEVTNERTS